MLFTEESRWRHLLRRLRILPGESKSSVFFHIIQKLLLYLVIFLVGYLAGVLQASLR